jgi:hypothetical protein
MRFNSVWAFVLGQADRRPSAAEIQKMRDLLTENLRQGAWGVSAGLDYKPGYFARTDEVIAVLQAATPWRTNFPNHDRLSPYLAGQTGLGALFVPAWAGEGGCAEMLKTRA